MKFKNIKVKNLIIGLLIVLAYPLVKSMSADNKLLVFSDTSLILAFPLLIISIVYSLYLHGDFDTTTFIAFKYLTQTKEEYDHFENRIRDKRKDSFNYPLFFSIILLLLSFITSLLV